MMQTAVKGMVQVQSVTYRIVRVRTGQYEVVRLLDDMRVGLFSIGAQSAAAFNGATPELIQDIARAALQRGRTSWLPRAKCSPSDSTFEKVRVP
jgi:hypothetical protein